MSVEHIIKPNGDQFWYMDGKAHREGGPAIIRANGIHEWKVHGLRHREDGPARISNLWGGTQEWWINGVRHREDGPAIINNYFVVYYEHGVKIKDGPYNSEIHDKYRFKPGSKTKAAPRDYPQ